MKQVWLIGFLALSWWAMSCLPETASVDPGVEHAMGAIVNGEPETGWPAVGALTATMQGYYVGQFCTGTLIAPQWVLTAAHCVTSTPEFPISERATRFFVGSDATPTASGGAPTSGTFYGVEKFYPHPQYRATDYEIANDVALVKLAGPVSSVTPVSINVRAMDSSFRNQTVLYVGFGNSDGYEGQTNGIKRRGTMKIVDIGTSDYTSIYGGQGVCAGDSGGPGLYEVDGEWVVIGVNSTVGNPRGEEPCMGYANHMRVDVYGSWIASILGMPPPDCRNDPSVCECPTACQADGSCNNQVCQTWSCEEIYDCAASCADQACRTACIDRGTPEGQQSFNALVTCLYENCGNAGTDEEFQQCAAESCGDEIDQCFPGQTGDLSCEEAYDCMVGCPDGDRTCLNDCWSRGSAQAQRELGSLFTCFNQKCGTIQDETAWRECVLVQCKDPILTCLSPADCDLRGGGCEGGQACAPWLWEHTDCAPSLGGGFGSPCDPDAEGALPCGDGLTCVVGEEGATCQKVCLGDEDCPEGGACEGPVFEGRPEGTCGKEASCTDEDEDGVCVPQDCDDRDATRHPGETEVCGNAMDDNCDGQTDEECPGDPAGEDAGSNEPDASIVEDSGVPGADGRTAADAGGAGEADGTVLTGGDADSVVEADGRSSGGCSLGANGGGGLAVLLPGLLGIGLALRRRRS